MHADDGANADDERTQSYAQAGLSLPTFSSAGLSDLEMDADRHRQSAIDLTAPVERLRPVQDRARVASDDEPGVTPVEQTPGFSMHEMQPVSTDPWTASSSKIV